MNYVSWNRITFINTFMFFCVIQQVECAYSCKTNFNCKDYRVTSQIRSVYRLFKGNSNELSFLLNSIPHRYPILVIIIS